MIKTFAGYLITVNHFFCSLFTLGTLEERGLEAWDDQNDLIPERDEADEDDQEAGVERRRSDNALKLYDLPFGMRQLNRYPVVNVSKAMPAFLCS